MISLRLTRLLTINGVTSINPSALTLSLQTTVKLPSPATIRCIQGCNYVVGGLCTNSLTRRWHCSTHRAGSAAFLLFEHPWLCCMFLLFVELFVGEVLSVLFGWDSGSGLAVGFQGLNFWLLHEVTPSSICFSCDKPSATLLDFSKPSTRYLQPPRPRPQSIRTSLRGWVTQHLDLEVPDCQNSEKS